jgi:hypothetical protein
VSPLILSRFGSCSTRFGQHVIATRWSPAVGLRAAWGPRAPAPSSTPRGPPAPAGCCGATRPGMHPCATPRRTARRRPGRPPYRLQLCRRPRCRRQPLLAQSIASNIYETIFGKIQNMVDIKSFHSQTSSLLAYTGEAH